MRPHAPSRRPARADHLRVAGGKGANQAAAAADARLTPAPAADLPPELLLRVESQT